VPTLDRDGTTIHYEVHGEGRPVVLVHGLCVTFRGNFGAYGWVPTLVEAGFQVVGMDCRGHGKSGKHYDPSAYGVGPSTADILAVVEHLRLDRPALVGYSLGSLYALHLAHAHPDAWSAIALCATGDGLVGGEPSVDTVRRDLVDALDRDEEPSDLPPHIAIYWTFATKVSGDIRALRALARGSYPTVTREEAARVKAPTLVVGGEKDLVLGAGHELAASVPGARHLVVPGMDHFSLAIDPTAQRAIADFLRSA